jgi:hypothetical protein
VLVQDSLATGSVDDDEHYICSPRSKFSAKLKGAQRASSITSPMFLPRTFSLSSFVFLTFESTFEGASFFFFSVADSVAARDCVLPPRPWRPCC